MLQKITSSDNIGGDIKASLAQVVAIEMSRVKDARNVVPIKILLFQI